MTLLGFIMCFESSNVLATLIRPLTGEPWGTQTGEPAHSVHTGGSVPAGL